MKNLFLLLHLLFAALPLLSQNYYEDTVWTRKTDQSQGFYMVKFSNTDSLIVGHGYENDLFFDAKTGQEIKRISGNNEVFFIDNDRKFIRTNEPRTKFEIFDAETYQIIDSLENDGKQSTGSIDITKDEKYLISNIPAGIRIWDLQTKKILRTNIYDIEQNLIYLAIDAVFFTCDESKLIGHLVKTYQDPNYPGDERYYKTYGCFAVYDFNTLDSIDSYPNARYCEISNTCKYFAVATGDVDYGVEIYDFNTKELIWKIPINGPSLTGIEFSPDDKYMVTSNGPGANTLKNWNMDTGVESHNYLHGSYDCIDISHNGKYIIVGNPRLILYYSRFGETSTNDNKNSSIIIYPNPATNIATVQFYQELPEITNIDLIDINGISVKSIFNSFLDSGSQSIEFNTGYLPNGSYFVKVRNSQLSLMFKLIVNK